MVRVDPAQSDALVATTKATLVDMRGWEMPSWLRVRSGDLRTDDQLAPWVEMGTEYALAAAQIVAARRGLEPSPSRRLDHL